MGIVVAREPRELRQLEADLGLVEAGAGRFPLPARAPGQHLDEGARLPLGDAVAYARRGRGERRRPSHGWDSLTPSEQRVVELVAAGLPNRDIAKKLFVSLATVKTHLVHVYTKLDVRTRTELAAAMIRRGLTPGGDRPPGKGESR